AQAQAAEFLEAQGLDPAAMALRSAQQERKPARTDSTFVWEAQPPSAPSPLPGEVAYRVTAELEGARVSHFSSWYFVPDARFRAFEQSTLGSIVLQVLRGLLYAAAVAVVLGLLFRFARRANLSWSALLKISVAVAVVVGIVSANSLPVLLANYPTEVPWSAFLLRVGLEVAVSALGAFLLTLALLAPLAITAPAATALTVANARRQIERESAWDALWVGLLALGWVVGWERVQAVVNARWHAAGSATLPSPPDALMQWLPGLSNALGAPVHALWVAAGLGILLPVLWHAWRNPGHRAWCLAGVGLLWIGTFPAIHHPQQFALAAIFSAVWLVLLFGFGYLFLRESPLAYYSAALLPLLVGPAVISMQVDAPPA
ncbi:MAG: hypothetical protein ACRDOE_22575, partial [Streptosporangiaceae bacterium]